MSKEKLLEEFQSMDNALNNALVTNQTSIIAALLSDDWVIVEPQFGIVSKEQFLAAIDRGDLIHSQMEKQVLHLNMHADIAVLVSKGRNIGSYKSIPYNSEQWVTSIYRKENDRWLCCHTQESPVSC